MAGRIDLSGKPPDVTEGRNGEQQPARVTELPQGQCLAMDMWFIEREKNLFAGHLRRDFLSSRA